MQVTLKSIREHIEFRRKINQTELKDIELVDNGVIIPFSEDILKRWNVTGLSNITFFEMEVWLPENNWVKEV